MKSICFTIKPSHLLYIPFAHFKMLQGLAYSLMSFDKALAAEVHDRNFPDKKAFKFFCFSDLIGRYTIRNGGLIYRDCFQWELRSADDEIIDAAEQAVRKSPVVTINRHPCEALSYEIRKKRFCVNAVDLQMNTPIVQNKYEMFCDKPIPGGVIIECNAPSDKDKCVTRYEKSIINAWYGKYRVTAEPEVLDFIWHTGLGSKNSMGFGTVSEP